MAEAKPKYEIRDSELKSLSYYAIPDLPILCIANNPSEQSQLSQIPIFLKYILKSKAEWPENMMCFNNLCNQQFIDTTINQRHIIKIRIYGYF